LKLANQAIMAEANGHHSPLCYKNNRY